MELLESQDPEKIRLIETSDQHKKALEKEMKSMSDKTERVVKNALIIGGVLAATYFVVSQLSSPQKKKKRAQAKALINNLTDEIVEEEDETPSIFSQISAKVADTATIVLIDLAKDALADFLKNRKQQNGDT
ncbi:MAG: hypothetical protein ORN54_09430 [Cyclobacteriaceae bacterium]|nr:hypothetical protein [Cyclobacteriaceae bacterium]